MVTSIFIAGLGGQGVVTLSKLIAAYASEADKKVTLFNSKGMAQRGGRVTSEIRISANHTEEYGSRISNGDADILVGMELGEAVNSLSYLKKEGVAVLLDYSFVPTPMILKKEAYPSFSDIADEFSKRTDHLHGVRDAETPHNIFVLGVLTAILESGPTQASTILNITREAMEKTIEANLKRRVEENIAVFRQGHAHGKTIR
jgi:indolepyruvate ferredoxin oxidoreductase beta subunit